MTESEWLTASDPLAMFAPLSAREKRFYLSAALQKVAGLSDLWDSWAEHNFTRPGFMYTPWGCRCELCWEPTDPKPYYPYLADVIRDIHPFQPVTFLPEWRTDTVLALAEGMYESRDFSAMPILADALQESGCEDETILGHCRGPGPHVRGCFCVDACLGKV